MTTTELVFNDITPLEQPVTIGDKKYILREAMGDAVIKYRNCLISSTVLKDGKPVGVNGLADAEPLLVSLCLFAVDEKTGNPAKVNVPVSQVRAWPYRIQKSLFDAVKKLSPEIDEKDTKESLVKQAADIQEKLAMLENEESMAKN